MQHGPQARDETSIHLDTTIPSTDLIQGVFPSSLMQPSTYDALDTSVDNWEAIYSYLGMVNHERHKRRSLILLA